MVKMETDTGSKGPDAECSPHLLDLGQLPGVFHYEEGFSRPDWTVVRKAIQQTVSPENLSEAWSEAAMQWVRQLRSDLGGGYTVRSSVEFLLLSTLDARASRELLAFAEATLGRIVQVLKEAAWKPGYGKHVILLFAEIDDYYQYVSFFCTEGEHPASGGCLIHKDYVHIALPHLDGRNIRRTLVHELVHNTVVHLPLPLWLNEGLAVLFDRTAADAPYPMLDGELRDRHMAFWNPGNIQKFWAGTSFGEPGDSNELSYSLAEIIVNLLLSEHGSEFGVFLTEAKWADAGQTAALDCLGANLGDVMGTFLGQGDWRPYRKVMVECWNAVKKPSGNDERATSRTRLLHPL